MFAKFDGTGRPPRQLQTDAFNWLRDNWHKFHTIGIEASCGVGKSGIAQAISQETGGHVVVVSNALMDQYIETYPERNYVKGLAHYKCDTHDINCTEVKEIFDARCKGCTYDSCRSKAKTEATIFNPISYWVSDTPAPDVLIIDEAHRLVDTLMLLCGVKLRKSKYNYPDTVNDVSVVTWMNKQVELLTQLAREYKRQGQLQQAADTVKQRDSIKMAAMGVVENPQRYAVYEERTEFRGKKERYLCVMPVELPRFILKPFLECKKLILLSATLPEPLVKQLALGREHAHLSLPSPIPAEQRKVVFDPVENDQGTKNTTEQLARWIAVQRKRYPGNTIVHVTYARAKELKEHFPEALINTPETKMQVLAEFKAKGGLWFAAGCAEGIDLPGDICRLNLIPTIMWANYGDPVVQKRLALPGGRLQYDLDALTLLQQQVGRSTRGTDDWSVTVVGDKRMITLVNRLKAYVPQSFYESIKWRP